jgi:hypothetical protein
MKWEGMGSFLARCKKDPETVLRVTEQELYATANNIITDAKQLTPVDTGALRSSGHVQLPTVVDGHVEVKMGFGGPAVSYATYVHEDLQAHHPVGQAKFLEIPFNNRVKTLMKRLKALIQRV